MWTTLARKKHMDMSTLARKKLLNASHTELVNIFIIYLSSNSASACLSERKRNLNEERERVVRCNTIASKESEN